MLKLGVLNIQAFDLGWECILLFVGLILKFTFSGKSTESPEGSQIQSKSEWCLPDLLSCYFLLLYQIIFMELYLCYSSLIQLISKVFGKINLQWKIFLFNTQHKKDDSIVMNCELILELCWSEDNIISGCRPMGQIVCCGTIQRLYKDNWSGKCSISFIMVSFGLAADSELLSYPEDL